MNKLKEYINNISYLNENVFRELEKCFTPLQLQKNDFFVREGEYARKIGFLQEGIVRAFFLMKKEKNIISNFLLGLQ